MGAELEPAAGVFNPIVGYSDSRLIGGSSDVPRGALRIGREEMPVDEVQGIGEGENFVPILPAEKRPEFKNAPKQYGEVSGTVKSNVQVITNEFINVEDGSFCFKQHKGTLSKEEVINVRSILASAVKRQLLEEIERVTAASEVQQEERTVEMPEASADGGSDL